MQSVIDFIMAHTVVMAGVLVGVLDFIFAMNKSLEANGILHSIYVFLKNLVTKKDS